MMIGKTKWETNLYEVLSFVSQSKRVLTCDISAHFKAGLEYSFRTNICLYAENLICWTIALKLCSYEDLMYCIRWICVEKI